MKEIIIGLAVRDLDTKEEKNWYARQDRVLDFSAIADVEKEQGVLVPLMQNGHVFFRSEKRTAKV